MRVTFPDDSVDRVRVAQLFVEALEVGSGKQEYDVAHEVFAQFGLDLDDILASVPPNVKDRLHVVRNRAASRLGSSARSVTALVDSVTAAGGRFVAMLDEIYGFLTEHVATTVGSNETLTLKAGGSESITISPAFLTEVRRLELQLRRVPMGRPQVAMLDRFLVYDSGEFFGTWPLREDRPWDDVIDDVAAGLPMREGELALASIVLTLSALDTTWRARCWDDPGWYPALEELNAAQRAAEGLVGTAERLVADHAIRLKYPLASRESDEGSVTRTVSALEQWCAKYQGHMPPRGEPDHLSTEIVNPEQATSWALTVTTACQEAQQWLLTMVWPDRRLTTRQLVERIEQFLHLPVWRQRSLIYEVWLLVETIRTCSRAGWEVDLLGVDPAGWRLPVARGTEPVAELRRSDVKERLHVWREPRRCALDGGELTPDITVSTVGDPPRDLLIVEAKDKFRLSTGVAQGAVAEPARRSALGLATRYDRQLRPRLTWLCNHESFAGTVDPIVNHGDPWSAVHLSASFRPGEIPAAFQETVNLAIQPLFPAEPGTRKLRVDQAGGGL